MTNEELCLKFQAGDTQALESLYLQNVKLIAFVANRFTGLADIEDLEQQAFFSLETTAREWRPDSGAKFTTYFVKCCRRDLQRYIFECETPIRRPDYFAHLLAEYKAFVNDYKICTGAEPEPAEILQALQITEKQLQYLQVEDMRSALASLDAPTQADKTLIDNIPGAADPCEQVTEKIFFDEVRAQVWSAVDRLKREQGQIIRAYYQEDKNIKQIAEEWHTDYQTIKNEKNKALQELAHPRYKLRGIAEELIYNNAVKGTGAQRFKETGTSATERVAIRLYEKCTRE